ncbi:hypothetical protein TpMuguga_03g00664 [Theileria parva strain Muguga]|uniref:Uncharacterized protein n=1 Tax=Theileria parva TaxID=5875 RepID=Q4MZ27_THEPA|nr:uncharacterized protein TpMuguga_03g00664 [Theileria parva strain Muguga]EAN30505.1 hypothetical protein TpMuguga_03g00664 [Theileria parva strain Muguga]|eukprot:XP_762788.1 hypothetical protein [Theileria parva strain Muguga]
MQFTIFVLFTALTASFHVSADKLDLKPLVSALLGKQPEGDKPEVSSGCPLGPLPDTVLLHKTYKIVDYYFTWVKPVHNKVTEVVCGSYVVWKGDDSEVLLDLHFVGTPTSDKKFVHLEYAHRMGVVSDSFLVFDRFGTPKPLDMVKFVLAVLEMVPGFNLVKGLPGDKLTYALVRQAFKVEEDRTNANLRARLRYAIDAEALATRQAKSKVEEAQAKLSKLEGKLEDARDSEALSARQAKSKVEEAQAKLSKLEGKLEDARDSEALSARQVKSKAEEAQAKLSKLEGKLEDARDAEALSAREARTKAAEAKSAMAKVAETQEQLTKLEEKLEHARDSEALSARQVKSKTTSADLILDRKYATLEAKIDALTAAIATLTTPAPTDSANGSS